MNSIAFNAVLMLWILQDSFTSSEGVCGPPPVLNNGLITNDDGNYEVGKVLTYSCDYGFVSQNNRRTAECTEVDGEPVWREPDILCIPRSCGDPGTVDHGQRKGHVFTFANRVEYVCDEGYRLVGRSTRYCQTSGQWSDRLPTCKVVECKAPNHPAEGKVFYNSLEYESELKYECNKGFQLKPKENRICDSNGKWSGQEPICEVVSCSQAESPANGRVQVIGDGNAGTIALYTCDPGTKLVGSASSKCLDSGQWIFDAPKCARPCRTPSVSNGRFGNYATSQYNSRRTFKTVYEGTVTDDGTEFVWMCNSNYEAPGNGERENTVVCENGAWSKDIQCVPAHCRSPPPAMQNAYVESFGKAHGGTVSYKCNQFFQLIRQSTVICHFGTWTGSTGQCRDTRCNIDFLDQIPGLVNVHEQRNVPSGYSFLPSCDGNYQRSETDHGTISCEEGQWKGNPSPCVPASCTHRAPEAEHGKSRPYQQRHGSTVQYDCDDGYSKTQQGNVNCQYGVWIGNPPVCEIIRNCQVPFVRNGFIGKYGRTRQNSKSFLKASPNTNVNFGEEYVLKCNKGFEASGQRDGETTVVCRNGGWFPQIQCTPAQSCTAPPPETINGKLQDHRTTHGTTVWYKCHSTHFKAKDGNVTCLYGEWKGDVPICKDKKCYLNDLVEKEGVQLTNTATLSGSQAAELTCEEGYSRAYLPQCRNSDWKLQDNKSPCQPSPCEVHNLENGRIQQLKVKNRINLGIVKFWKKEYFDDAEIGSKIEHGEEAFVSCDHPYIFNGKDSSETVRIHCIKGQWTPYPQCLIRNIENEDDFGGDEVELEVNNSSSNNNPEATEIIIDDLKPSNLPSNRNESDRNNSIATRGKIPFIEHVTVATTNASLNGTSFIGKNISVEQGESDLTNPGEENVDSCTCTYEGSDQTLNAYVGDDLLRYRSEVQNGLTVKFRCRDIGYYRFSGSKETRCLDCNWNISKFPRCTEPNDNDPIIRVPADNGNTIITAPDGVMVIRSGTQFSFTCSTYYPYMCPQWRVRTVSGTAQSSGCTSTTMGDKYSLSVWYHTYNAKTTDSGRYECQVGNGKPHYIQVEVRDLLCPEIKEGDSVIVTYSNGRKVYSVARFTCSHPDWQLVGRNSIRCLENGQWTGESPICKYVECPLIPESNGMTIDYRPNRLVNGRAVFRCQSPLKRYGPVSLDCLASGTWSGQFASCRKPMCPEIPQSDSLIITYNGDRNIQSTATFQCANPDFILIGPETIFCLSTEKWNENPPICKYVTCNMATIYDVLPHGVVPKVENLETDTLPVGHSFDLGCDEENRYVSGSNKINCETSGQWRIAGSVKCELGCGPLKKDSTSRLIINKEKDNYIFGDYVELSCPPGEILTEDVVRVFCLSNGWSEQDIPDCKPAKT